MRLTLCCAGLMALLLDPAYAETPLVLNAEHLTDTRMTMYPGQTLLEQRYRVDLKPAEYRLQLTPVSDLLMFETLQISSPDAEVDQIRLQRQILTPKTFYQGLLGQTVMVYQNGDLQAPHRSARLSVWHEGVGIATLDSGEQLLIDLNDPKGLRIASPDNQYQAGSFMPLLSARILQQASSQALNLKYFSQGIGYHIYYQLQVDHSKQQISGRAVGILRNQTNTDYNDTNLVLASGDTGASRRPVIRHEMMAADAARTVQKVAGPEALGELRFYPVEGSVDLPAYSEQQLTLLSFADIEYQDHYQLTVSGMRASNSAAHPQRIYNFKADQNLPAGEMRLFEEDAGGHLQWILASNIAASGQGQSVIVQAAEASDISIQREVVQQQRLDRNLLQVDWRVQLYNSKPSPVWVEIRHRDHNLLKISAASDIGRPADNVLRFELAPGKSELLYSAQYRQ